jgi:hypothetical protein
MTTITLELPDALAAQVESVRDRLPELLALSLRQPALPATLYRDILALLVGRPSPEEIVAFQPGPEMQERLRVLLQRTDAGELTSAEQTELDEFERIEHFMVMLKAGNFPQMNSDERLLERRSQ